MEKDYYKILNVPPSATTRQIKRSFRSLALKYHPDRIPENMKEEAERIFKEITEAYEVLSTPKKRRVYNRDYTPNEKTEFRFNHEHGRREASYRSSWDDIHQEWFCGESFWSLFELDTKSKLFAVILSGIYLLANFWADGSIGVFSTVIFLILPLACIFFSEEIGDFQGWTRGIPINQTTPGIFITFCGWILLLMPFWLSALNYICSK